MTDNFFAEFARPSYQPPPGFALVDDKDYPPPPRQTTARGLEAAGASGINAGLAGTLGAPVDVANVALRGLGLETAQTPIMGSAWLRDIERRVGIRPDLPPDATTAEKIAHAAGYGAAATTVPAAGVGLLGEAGTLTGAPLETAQAITGAPTPATAALGAAAGGAGGAAAEAAPKGYETAASLAAQLATGHAAGKALGTVTPAEALPSNIEQFLNEADVAAARAAGAKTKAEIDEFIRNKETANAPRIGTQVPQAAGSPVQQPEGIGEGAVGGPAGIPGVLRGPDETGAVHPAIPQALPPAEEPAAPTPAISEGASLAPYKPPEGFEEVSPGFAPKSAPPAQLAEKSAISTPKNAPEIVPNYAPEGTFREDEFGMPQLVEATGLRPIDIDPQAAAAAKQHVANGATPDVAYEHAVIEAALADPKVQGIQDGEQLPAAPEPIQNAPAAAPEPRSPIAGTGAAEIRSLRKSSFGSTEITPQGAPTTIEPKNVSYPRTMPERPSIAGIPGLAEHKGALSSAEPSEVQGLGRPGNLNLPEMAAQLSSVPGGYGGAPVATALSGQEGQQQGVRTGQLPVGSPSGSGTQQAQQPASSVEGRNVANVGSGQIDSGPERNASTSVAGHANVASGGTYSYTLPERSWARGRTTELIRADGTISAIGSPSEQIARHLLDTGPLSKEEAAKIIGLDPSDPQNLKRIDESAELGVVIAARQIVNAGASPDATFDRLVKLYDDQPKLGTRTSSSMRDQSYSTPIPLAYAASRLAGIVPGVSVYEPTAGNGALLIEAHAVDTVANEINPGRFNALKSQGFLAVAQKDASLPATAAYAEKTNDGPFDALCSNPPFGVRHGEGGAGDRFDLSRFQPGYETGEIDHAIALNSLSAMKPDGRAVLILGGPSPLARSDEARVKAYGSKSKREFYKVLFDHFNVTKHVTVSGNLYEKQGAAWPIDLIVIWGAGRSVLPYPMTSAPPILESWQEVKEMALASDARNEGNAGIQGVGERQGQGIQSEPRAGQGLQRAGNINGLGVGGELPGVPGGSRAAPIASTLAGPQGQRQGIREGQSPLGIASDLEPEQTQAPIAALGRPNAPNGPNSTIVGAASENAPISPRHIENAVGIGPQETTPAEGQGRALRVKESSNAQQPANPQPVSKPRGEANASGPAVGTAGHDIENQPLDVGRGNAGPANRPEGEPATLRGANVPEQHEHREPPAANQPAERPSVARPGRVGGPSAPERRPPGVEPRAPRTAPAAPPQPEAPKEAETENQVAYSPKSTAGIKLGTLAPRNMRDASDAALASAESRHGPIAKYVSHELGYKAADLGKHYSAEQVDALGLAIDNIERGGSLVLGDQTGIGKGRVLAGMIRYGIRQGMTPIFVTEKPRLYAAMFDDMTDIGMQDMLGREPTILPTNNGLKLPLGIKGTILKSPKDGEQDQQLRDIAASGKLPDHDMIMTTYAQMQTVKGESTARRDFLRTMAPNAIILFDESHNAGGTAAEKRISKNKPTPPPDRAEFARELVDKAKAVVYSSATYAKRPDSMRLYSKTDMRYAVGNMKDLGEAIKKGGVPMQQVVASALAESGQYLRRERSFDGIRYDTEVTPIDRTLYAGFSKALRAINDFSKVASKSVKSIDKEVKAEAAIAGQDASVGTAGAESTNFTSLMHNVVAQFLLSSKAERAGQLAIEAINKGERPVIAVANTLESFVSDYMEQTGAKTGDLIRASFGDLLSRYLDRSRVVTIKKPFGAVTDKHTMTDDELGPEGLAAYHAAQAIINGLDFGKLPISPIDRIRQVILSAGHAVSEITGRSNILDYGRGNIPQIMTRSPKEKSEAGAAQTIKDFNSGKLKALILNESGATGISLHDSEAFPESGRGRRAMIIAQAHPNIDTHMQMLGRVNRTGQLSKPRYAQLGADVAAEKRPMAVLAKKLASLNANTTASAKGGLSSKGAVDFLNRYGDEVVTQVMLDDMRAHIDMGEPLDSLSPTDPDEDAARRMTGRIAFLEPDAQDRIMDAIESQYKAKIDDLDERGENALEAKNLDLKAKYEGGADISQKTGDSPFQNAVHVGTYDVKSDRKPPKFDDVMKSAYAMLGREIVPKFAPLEALQTAGGKSVAAMMTRADQAFNEYKSAMLAITKDPEIAAEQRHRLAAGKENMREKLATIYPGAVLHTHNNLEAPLQDAVVVGVKHEGKTLNPYAESAWEATIAMPGLGTRHVPFSQLTTIGAGDALHVSSSKTRPDELAKMFDSFKSEMREKRVIATGNLLAAYDLLHRAGQIVNFTMDDSTVRQGLMMPRAQTSHKEVAAGAVKKLADPDQIVKFLEKPGGEAVSTDRVINITSRPQGGFLITVAGARSVGGKYFLDPGVLSALGRDEFIKRGVEMRAGVGKDIAPAVFEALIKAGANFQQEK